jgi:phosphoglycolate phosphatase
MIKLLNSNYRSENKNMEQIQKNKKALLIDLDGTLVDTEKLDDLVMLKVLKENGSSKKFKAFIGCTLDEYIDSITLDNKLKQKIKREFVQEYTFLLRKTKLILNHKLLELLKQKSNLKFALVTSNTKKITALILRKIGLLKFFDVVITCEDVENQKPHPEPFLKAVTFLRVNPTQCTILEDSQAGLQSAKLAGIDYQKITIGKGVK